MLSTLTARFLNTFNFGCFVNWIYLIVAVCIHEPISCVLWKISQTLQHLVYGDQNFCIHSVTKGTELCRPACGPGQFSLHGMEHCLPLLTCDNIQDVQKLHRIGRGLVKQVYLAKWREFNVAYSELTSSQYREDFRHGLKLLQRFQGNQKIVQLIGFCDGNMITEYHTLGESTNFNLHFAHKFPEIDNIVQRLHFCIDYVEILTALHSATDNMTYVMCDTNSLDKVLSQYLLSDDMHLVLNDVDSVAEVINEAGKQKGIKCGRHELEGEFIAPEQRWSGDTDFSDIEMQTYDEKTDIWKVPTVCNHFLGSSPEATRLQMRLLDIHMACKNWNPEDRPSAEQIAGAYKTLLKKIHEIKQDI